MPLGDILRLYRGEIAMGIIKLWLWGFNNCSYSRFKKSSIIAIAYANKDNIGVGNKGQKSPFMILIYW